MPMVPVGENLRYSFRNVTFLLRIGCLISFRVFLVAQGLSTKKSCAQVVRVGGLKTVNERLQQRMQQRLRKRLQERLE